MPTQAEFDALKEKLAKMEKKMKDASAAADSLSGSLGKLMSTGQQSSTKVGEISKAYQSMESVLANTTKVTNKLTENIESLVEKIPGLGGVAAKAVGAIGLIGDAFGKLSQAVAAAPRQFITALDDQTRGLRAFEAELFDLSKRFGGSIEETRKFADSLRTASGGELAKSLHLTTNEMMAFVRQTRNTSLTQDQLSKVVQTGAGAIELYGAATAFAESTNTDLNSAATILNTLMNKQGKSAQEATNMLGMYIGVSEETGLSVDKVAGSLNSAVQNFHKIGMAADFGKPILKGFGDTMKDMGLGIENAVGLSQSLTQSLASLTNNYAMAHITFQRGGLDIGGGGGGGVLGSSIALQSAFLDAEKTGDQAAISDQLVRGMRDTLASFTGGDIVTVQQANEDPSMQRQFYVQQQMLKQQFGLQDDNSASRVLDMLSRLDEATRTGDVEAQKNLKEQIEKEKRGRDLTLDEMEKVNRNLEIQINLMTVEFRHRLDETRRVAGSTGRALSEGMDGKGTFDPVRLARKGLDTAGAQMKRMADYLGLEKGSSARNILEDGNWTQQFEAYNRATRPMNKISGVTTDSIIDMANTTNPNDINHSVVREAMEHALGSKFSRGGKVAAVEVDRIANAILKDASAEDISKAGGKDQMYTNIVQQLKSTLENVKVDIALTKEASNAFQAAVKMNKSAQKVNTPGSP